MIEKIFRATAKQPVVITQDLEFRKVAAFEYEYMDSPWSVSLYESKLYQYLCMGEVIAWRDEYSLRIAPINPPTIDWDTPVSLSKATRTEIIQSYKPPQLVMDILSDQPQTSKELSVRMGIPKTQMRQTLQALSLEGKVTVKDGGWVSLIRF